MAEGLTVIAAGLVVVLCIMASMFVLIEVILKLDQLLRDRAERASSPQETQRAEAPPAADSEARGKGDEVIAAIGLALQQHLGRRVAPRSAAAGTGAGWFSADGPGPSLQGIMRGQRGASGALGVVTKVAAKLYDWCGTKMWNFVGDAANYVIDGKLEGYEIYTITFPTKNDMFEAVYLLHEEQIALSLMRTNPTAHILAVPEGNDEAWELWQKSVGEAGADRILTSVTLCVNARSARQKEFNERVINKVIQKMHGELTPELNSPVMQAKNLANTLLATGGVRAAFRVVGCFSGAAHGSDSLDLCKRLEEVGIELERPYIERGDFLQIWEYGQMASENNTVGGRGGIYIQYDPWDPKSLQAARQIAREGPQTEVDNYAVPKPGEPIDESRVSFMGGRTPENVGDWAGNIKWTFDPNNVSDGDSYPLPVPPIKPNAGESDG